LAENPTVRWELAFWGTAAIGGRSAAAGGRRRHPKKGEAYMSKHMQLIVKVQPYYKENLKAVYPKIAGHLSRVDQALVEKNPSIFDLVGKLDKLLYALDGNPAFKEILLKHKDALFNLYDTIQNAIADWQLAQADQALYKLEDIFDEIEWELDKA
jgi:hypothetical protein